MSGLPTPRRLVSPAEEIASVRRRLSEVEARLGRMNWLGSFQLGRWYQAHDVVSDGEWTMVALEPTNERAAPQPDGVASYVYAGADPTAAIVAKTVISGMRATFGIDGYFNGYRIYTVTGNEYAIYTKVDSGQLVQQSVFTATTTGWIELEYSPTIVAAGTVLSIVVLANEPDPTPTVWSGNWNYTTPNNVTVPAAGTITHSSKALDVIRVNKTDDDAGDRAAELLALTPGDIVNGVGVSWSIQSVTDDGSYVTLIVAPAVQGSPDGVSQFGFETVTPTPITYLHDPNYWTSNPPANGTVEGLYVADGGLADLVADDDAYGVDILVQPASISDDWDVVSFSGSGGGGGSDFVSIHGDVMDGQLDVDGFGVHPQIDVPDASVEASGYPYGVSIGLVGTAVVGYPTTYATVFTVKENESAGRSFQLVAGRDGRLWLRTSSGTGTDWTGFSQIGSDEGWTDAALQNGWVDYGSTYEPIQYRLGVDGVVHIKGLMKSGTTTPGTVVLTLPADMAPAGNRIVSVRSNTEGSVRCNIGSNGNVSIGTGAAWSSSWTSMEVSFPR